MDSGQVEPIEQGPEREQACPGKVLEVKRRAVGRSGGSAEAMIAHHARLEDQPPAGATQAQAQVEILVVKEEPGVETTDLTPGIWGDGYCGFGDKANLPPAASGGRGMLLPDSPRQVIEPPTGIPIVGCIVSAPNRPASCADPVFESIGRRIQETPSNRAW